MMIDLHLHSNFSDGLDTPKELIDKALASGHNLRAIALTDHDTIEGLEEFLAYGEEQEIITIPGIEISIKHEPERYIRNVHIVGLNIDHNSDKLITVLSRQLKGRIEQKKKICIRLKEEFDYNISFSEVKAIASGQSIGRPHIVEIMIKNNPKKVKGYSKNELFKFISLGGPAYVFREYELCLEDAIELIDSTGGIPILAHPGIYEVNDRAKFIEFCVNSGIKGLEIEYTYSKNRPFYNTEKSVWAQEFLPNYFNTLANKFTLLKSGGSDYHGGKKRIEIGEAGVPDKYLKNFI